MSGAILEEFHRARREAKKLSLALDALHPSAQVPEEDKKELMQYLSYRKRSAVTELIRQGDLDGIKAMEKLGWLEAQYMAGYRAQASEPVSYTHLDLCSQKDRLRPGFRRDDSPFGSQ